jgi:hypothetical protein
MLMAAVCYYFAGGYGSFTVPVFISAIVTSYLVPLLFLSGLGLTLYAFLRA